MTTDDRNSELWARFRFAIIGPLLAAPPGYGELNAAIRKLAEVSYTHPITSEPYTVSVQTIERWFYEARKNHDPVRVLRRKVRTDAGRFRVMGALLITALDKQYRQHPTWSYQLHHDNLCALARSDEKLGSVPAYHTVRRFMKSQGWFRKRRKGDAKIEHGEKEIRSFETAFVAGLWHADFHHGKRKVLLPSGQWVVPKLLAVLDDRSRLCCHAQWYLSETTEVFVHGLTQAFLKRGLPRALLTDNGSAMTAAETEEGLIRLGALHETTLPYSPYQNGKQEAFFAPVEGRLVKMLEGVAVLDLSTLNEATQAWVELEHNQGPHSELGNETPVERFLAGPEVSRPSPDAQALSDAFRYQVKRKQRRSDGTISVDGIRYELPAHYRHLESVHVRLASWDKSSILLVDPRQDLVLCVLYPLDKEKNADGRRRLLKKVSNEPADEPGGIAPYLRELMTEYAATGLPPAYIALDETTDFNQGDDKDA